jgi:hypothetical protein
MSCGVDINVGSDEKQLYPVFNMSRREHSPLCSSSTRSKFMMSIGSY